MSHTLFTAKKIITMDPSRPSATAVLVSAQGQILAVGDEGAMGDWGPYARDDRFADKVLMPGFVEGHAHLMEGSIWRFTYCGHYDRIAPDGALWPGVKDAEALVKHLRKVADQQPEGPIVGWGLDPLFLPGSRLSRHELDRVSETRPVVVIHSNMHLLTANSLALKLAGYDETTDVPGVIHAPDGSLQGELQEMGAMFPVMRRVGASFADLGGGRSAIRDFARSACRAGVTTATDLLNELSNTVVDEFLEVTGEAGFPLRIVPMLSALALPAAELAPRAKTLATRSTDRLRLGGVKVMTDGSIQGFTAQLRAPGYYTGTDHGGWNIAPEALEEITAILHAEGVQMHIHVNGDLAIEVAIGALERAMTKCYRPDHRHVLQHCQMVDRAQLARIKALGLCVNFFSNHIHYFGDKHRSITLGPERAARMNPARSALDLGIPFATHSDAPITPLGPLTCAWSAINRLTDSGYCLGPDERITLDEALRAITLGAAYTLGLDGEIGSIEVGKRADFAVLEADPYERGPEKLREIGIWGTVLGGHPSQAGSF